MALALVYQVTTLTLLCRGIALTLLLANAEPQNVSATAAILTDQQPVCLPGYIFDVGWAPVRDTKSDALDLWWVARDTEYPTGTGDPSTYCQGIVMVTTVPSRSF